MSKYDPTIDGKKIAADIRQELKKQIKQCLDSGKRAPGLAVVLVGEDPASHYYVSSKQKACAEVCIESFKTVLAQDSKAEDIIAVINNYNQDTKVDGILLQLPLPDSAKGQTQKIVDSISSNKDVDGLTSHNLGSLVVKDSSTIYPCTPKGCMELLKRYKVEVSGKKALVIGRSTLVGKPIALMLNSANATVTMAHSKTQNLVEEVKQADILIAAIGSANFVKGEWLKSGAVVIDVGINAVYQDDKKKLVGDVDFSSAQSQASLITPVPGGVGPMTVAMLLSNTYELYLRNF